MGVVFILLLVACELGGLIAYLAIRDAWRWYQARRKPPPRPRGYAARQQHRHD